MPACWVVSVTISCCIVGSAESWSKVRNVPPTCFRTSETVSTGSLWILIRFVLNFDDILVLALNFFKWILCFLDHTEKHVCKNLALILKWYSAFCWQTNWRITEFLSKQSNDAAKLRKNQNKMLQKSQKAVSAKSELRKDLTFWGTGREWKRKVVVFWCL